MNLVPEGVIRYLFIKQANTSRHSVLCGSVCAIILFLNVVPVANMIIKDLSLLPEPLLKLTEWCPSWQTSFDIIMHRVDLLRIVNSYGLFSAVVSERSNLILEASTDMHTW